MTAGRRKGGRSGGRQTADARKPARDAPRKGGRSIARAAKPARASEHASKAGRPTKHIAKADGRRLGQPGSLQRSHDGLHRGRAGAAHRGQGSRAPDRSRERADVFAGPLGLPARRPEQDQELAQLAAAKELPGIGDWLWTTREGAERDCLEELLLGRTPENKMLARGLAPALVISSRSPRDAEGRVELTFARQGFPLSALAREVDEAALADRLARAGALLVHGDRFALHVFVPDSAQGNRLAQRAEWLEGRIEQALAVALPNSTRVADAELRRQAADLVQVCLFAPDLAALGVIRSDQALSVWPGGRARMRVSADRPSRAARKLEEAFAWLGTAPGPGELCVDLGAAPGGWSWLLLNRRARVIAVDPAQMDPQLAGDRRLQHVQGSAFDWQPDEQVDWLFCDMAWRPLEVAQMLGRWARRRQTRMLVANFKLPMKRKAEMVARLREVLETSGFTHVRARQLYHDREEITVIARLR